MFSDGPEYKARLARPYAPPTVTLKQIHDAVPKHLLRKNPWWSAAYVLRDITFTILLFKFASSINPWARGDFGGIVPVSYIPLVKYSLWATYYWFQGLVWAGVFCLGHDAGHGTLFNSSIVNNVVGFTLHTFLLIPYFAWRSTHHAHHKATGSIERDENYIPYTRSEYNLPEEKKASKADYAEIFEETPIYTLGRVLVMQGLGWWLYLTYNTMGSKMYPPGTSHWSPSSPLFKDKQRNSIIISNIALCCQLFLLSYIGPKIVLKYYLLPYLVMFTYLHHSDPTIPHYRKEEWSFLRGAASTVDRPLMGWMGRFFMHNLP
ncbi:hypothetical protein SERLA73DRAFT_190949 [Serpula lacrymans var. lacrymans S7.3]|uniref:Fatty acid desaturase domain-containing protein n=1 Tax=Serpula lacrymans var. lacrymans (strain S7.3) TaxID=936435 RepID=F8QGN9_SERL3|nr:hypothetical protein SERLA73DRAFT_190949 [Serpula lacrymans var. lacrymans S7.3]